MTTRERLAEALPLLKEVAQAAAESAIESGATWDQRERIADDIVDLTIECIDEGGYEAADRFINALQGPA